MKNSEVNPSVELRDAVLHLALNKTMDKINAFRAESANAITDVDYLMTERGWIYESLRWNYDKGMTGHNQLIRQALQDLGYVTKDNRIGEPSISSVGPGTRP